jgi:hypothetical protein
MVICERCAAINFQGFQAKSLIHRQKSGSKLLTLLGIDSSFFDD